MRICKRFMILFVNNIEKEIDEMNGKGKHESRVVVANHPGKNHHSVKIGNFQSNRATTTTTTSKYELRGHFYTCLLYTSRCV